MGAQNFPWLCLTLQKNVEGGGGLPPPGSDAYTMDKTLQLISEFYEFTRLMYFLESSTHLLLGEVLHTRPFA